MGKFSFTSIEGRPIFKSNGLNVLFASGSLTQASILDPEVLITKFGAELVLDGVRIDPYWQIGECNGAIYKLAHFPIDDTEIDFKGLYIFNTVPSEEYKEACKDPQVVAVGSVCDIVVGMRLFCGFTKTIDNEWTLEVEDNLDEVVKKANIPLQEIIDKSR